MVGQIAFLLFCIYQSAESIDDLVFPQNNQQFRLLRWFDCKTQEQIKLLDVDGQQQLNLKNDQGICLDQNYQLPLDQDYTYNYTFIFNRFLNEDELYIFIDYKMYNLSTIKTFQPYIQIQHYHYLTCMNSIEFKLNSDEPINLIFFYIAKYETNTKDQVILSGQLPSIDISNSCYYDFRKSFVQEIKNKMIYYQARISNSQEKQSTFYWFKFYLNNSVLQFSLQQQDINQSLIQGTQIITNENYEKLNNLPFLIKTQYIIRQTFLFMEMNEDIEFEIITQIDETFSQLVNDSQIRRKFEDRNQFRMLVEVESIMNNTFMVVKVLPKNYNKCFVDMDISDAKINIKNQQEDNIIECSFQNNDQNNSCLKYENKECSFYVRWEFMNNTEYSYELNGILRKQIESDPYIYFKTEREILYNMQEQVKESWNSNKYGLIIIMELLLGTLIFLVCVICILEQRSYHPYINYIIEREEKIKTQGRESINQQNEE
ncbi:unnamed protein product [Paramecium sonneborni]|uniref:Transmembrane protein n=1 Tax=Paramecium sonneborni TaxID=65129 RepID=A0A8S1JZ18_9CILI|nr:unnamed protein product [Paramecium sonneborni]